MPPKVASCAKLLFISSPPQTKVVHGESLQRRRESSPLIRKHIPLEPLGYFSSDRRKAGEVYAHHHYRGGPCHLKFSWNLILLSGTSTQPVPCCPSASSARRRTTLPASPKSWGEACFPGSISCCRSHELFISKKKCKSLELASTRPSGCLFCRKLK